MNLLVHPIARGINPENYYKQCLGVLPKHLHYRFIDRVGCVFFFFSVRFLKKNARRWLNLLDAMDPETDFDLDLRHLDHWKVAHILT